MFSQHRISARPRKRQRRTATAVMAGDFDERPARDVLTSLLNGVPSPKVEKVTIIIDRKAEKREKKRAKQAARAKRLAHVAEQSRNSSTSSVPQIVHQPSSFWKARPAIHIPVMQRSVSISPPPSPMMMQSSPRSTPGPSHSSSTSRTSSKRPRTPTDDDDDFGDMHSHDANRTYQRQPKREPIRKGWKGWVEGELPASEKLINLDAVPILQDRRTRSGKNFDALSVGKEGWI